MTSETDYSIHRAVGAPEIPGLRPPSDRQPRRKRRQKTDGKHQRRKQTKEEAVEVEVRDGRIDPVNVPSDDGDSPPETPAVDCLA